MRMMTNDEPLNRRPSAFKPPVCQHWGRPTSLSQAGPPCPCHCEVVRGERLRWTTTMHQPVLLHDFQGPGNHSMMGILRFVVLVLVLSVHHQVADLKMAVKQVIDVEVLVVVTKWVDQ